MRRTLTAASALVLVAACNTTGGALITLPFNIGGVAHDAGTPLTFTRLASRWARST